MRTLEFGIYGLVLVNLMMNVIWRNNEKKWQKFVRLTPLILSGLQIIREEYRWQMGFVYIISFIMGVISIYRIIKTKKQIVNGLIRTKNKRLGYVIGHLLLILLVSISMTIPTLLPVVHLPKPSGKFYVGTMQLYLEDTNREEYFTEDEKDIRKLAINVWYPADSNTKGKVSYWKKEDIDNGAYADFLLPGNFWYEYIALSKTNSQLNVPLSTQWDTYPIVIYSPSYGGFNTENTVLCEELASNGYIVFSIAHTYEAHSTIFPDGQVIKSEFSHIEERYNYSLEEENKVYEKLMKDIEGTTELKEIALIVGEYIKQDKMVNKIIDIRADDISFVIDSLKEINGRVGMFNNRFALDKIGAIGFSAGGASCIEVAYEDERISATINLDGWPFGEHVVNNEPITTPLLVFRNLSDNGIDVGDEAIWDWVLQSAQAEFKLVEVSNTMHLNFSDYPTMFTGMKYLGYYGMKDPDELTEIYHETILPFLDKYVKER